ncbi:GntR family transcriptional regulator / MocR family aminotransferase [Mycobacterium sp. 283mftsu]|nr:GntR family transcriptional regulator / MocR family aminotransferase [Mycobacterium sp. 283mftsu]
MLAADLQVSRRLVVDAYSQLVAEGFLQSQQGSGTTVAAVDTTTRVSQPSRPDRRTFDIDFAPGVPDLSSFPRQSWLRALRQGLSSIESPSLGYASPKGLPDARAAVSDYLRRTRGVLADPQRVVLCSGATQAIALLAQVLRHRAIAMEEPGFWLHRMVFRQHGIEPAPIPVDDDGLDVTALANTVASTVLATPAHQSPTGVVLSPARRTALLEWARAGNLVIEDDYDAEYRYDRAPVGALHALAPDRVVYLGSVSKTLAPGLRLGWMVLPPDLVGPVVSAKSLADTGSSVMDQLAFATLLRSGDYDRHLRLMRRRYLARRNALLAALGRYLPEAGVLGAAAGVHLTVRLPTDCNIDGIVREAANQRVRIDPLSWCYTEPDCAPPGLILGYANLTESQIDAGVRAIAAAVGHAT